ncbi:MAG: hypothetical protein EOM87_08205 [Clostridia bacterium]|nr:hypothetical protein [Clostridia bacterium]
MRLCITKENKHMETLYYLLAVLDDAAQERLTELSDLLTKEGFAYTKYTPYHITLWGGDKPDECTLNRFEEVCRTTPTIETALAFVGLFGLAVAFLAPLPCLPLITLEKNICGNINDAPDGWVPHVTLRMGDNEYIRRAAPVIAGHFTPFSVRIEKIELYECGNDYAKLVRSFKLRNK